MRQTSLLLLSLLLVGLGIEARSQSDPSVVLSNIHPRLRAVIARDVPESGIRYQAPLPEIAGINASGEPLYAVIVYTDRSDSLKAMGLAVQSILGSFCTARLSARDLLYCATLSWVRSVHPSGTVEYLNDLARALTGADLLHAGIVNHTEYRGTGVIVGVIDSGIDWKHLDFRTLADSTKSRVVAIWDQTLTPISGESAPSGFSYGVEYTQNHFNNELDGSPSGFVRSNDVNGHGTHVAGIATGNGQSLSNRRYQGMAPEADILFVKTTMFTSDIVDGLTWLKSKALALGRPIAVNISLGSNDGPHDGTDPLSQGVDAFSGPGRAVAMAAGNSGGSPIHLSRTLATGSTDSILITVPTYTALSGANNDAFGLDLWHEVSSNVSFTVVSPLNDTMRCRFNFDTTAVNNSGTLYLYNAQSPGNGDAQHYAYWYDSNSLKPPVAGVWKVFLSNASGTSSTWHCWLWDWSIGNPAKTITVTDGNTTSTVNNTAATATVAGSWVSRWRWTSSNGSNWLYSSTSDNSDSLSSFSSKGPTRTGAFKPDLAAPGQGIVSSSSSTIGVSSSELMGNGKQRLTQGTSMASPVVCGASALLLQRCPLLTGTRIREVLTSTAIADTMTRGPLPSTHWGYGKLQVYRAMRSLISTALPSGTVLHSVDQWKSDNAVSINTGIKLAVRFTPDWSATPATALFHLGSTVGFTGPLSFEIWSDNGSGRPLTKLGATVTMDRANVLPFSWNSVSLRSVGVTLTGGTNYHLVTYFSAGSSTSFSVDNGNVDNRSSVYNGSSWAAYGNDLRLRPMLVQFVPIMASGSYRIGGTGTVPCGGCQYVDLTEAIADLETKEIQGPVTLFLSSSYSSSEENAFPITIPSLPGTGPEARLRIAPDSLVTVTIAANSDTAVLRLRGADYVEVDGTAAGLAGRNLTLENTSTSAQSVVLRLQSPSTENGTSHITVRNTVLRGNAASTTFAALYSGGSTVSATDTALYPNSNTTIESSLLQRARYGVVLQGRSAALPGDSVTITSNGIGAEGGMGHSIAGLLARYQRYAVISDNDIREVRGSGTGSITGMTFQDLSRSTIQNNFIHGIQYTGASTTSVLGITTSTTVFNSSAQPSRNTFFNNRVADITSSGTSTSFLLSGMNANGGYRDRYYFNSIHLTGSLGSGTGIAAAFSNGNPSLTTYSDSLDFRNNILSVNGTASVSAKFHAHYSRATNYGSDIVNSTVLRSTAAGSATAYIGYIGGANRSTLATWRTASGGDALAVNGDPRFLSGTDLHIAPGSSYDPVPMGSRAGQPLAGFVTDMDGSLRDSLAPDIGADEFTLSRTLTASGSLPGSMGYDSISVNGAAITASLGADVGIASRLHLQQGALSIGARALTLSGVVETNSGILTGGSTSRLIIAGNGTACEIPAVTVKSLTVNRPTGADLGGEISIVDTLRMLNGLLRLGPYDCTLGASIVLPGTASATAMVVPTGSGFLKKTITGTGSFSFPVGDAEGVAEYTPVTMNFLSGTFSSAQAGVRLQDSKHPQNPALTNYLTRYWTLGQTGISAFNCTLTLRYTDADVVGIESSIFGSHNLSSGWTKKTAVNPTTNEIVITGLTAF